MSKKIDWGFPYTLHNYIILPETIVADIKDSPFSKNLLKTLLHEQFHILQRKYPDLFKNFYTNWNFFSSSGLILPDKIKKLLITNPDAPKANLMFKYNDSRFILPVLTVNDEDKKTHKPVFLPVSYTEGQFRVDESLVNTTQFKQIVKTYRKRFYNIKQNYHPNEIFANLIPNMNYTKPRKIYFFIKFYIILIYLFLFFYYPLLFQISFYETLKNVLNYNIFLYENS